MAGGHLKRSIVVDAHVHAPDYLPHPVAAASRWLTRSTAPPAFPFHALRPAGVDAVVANAVGDRVVTAWWTQPPWLAVRNQLARIRRQTEAAGGVVATSARDVRAAAVGGRLAVVLGLEGADAIGMDLDRIDELRGCINIRFDRHWRSAQPCVRHRG